MLEEKRWDPMIHIVKPGDTLYQISLDYRVSLEMNFMQQIQVSITYNFM